MNDGKDGEQSESRIPNQVDESKRDFIKGAAASSAAVMTATTGVARAYDTPNGTTLFDGFKCIHN